MGLSHKAIKAIASRYYLPYGCGIDFDDLIQEATIAAASVEDKGNGYARRTIHNTLGMLIERERAQKRLPAEGYRSMPDDIAGAQEGNTRATTSLNDIEATASLPPPNRTIEGEVYVAEILGALAPTSREVIHLRMNPRAMSGYYKRADKPIPPVASYNDISKHLGVSVASIMQAITEARRIVLADE